MPFFLERLKNRLFDVLWFLFFLLIGAGLASLVILTYVIPKRDSLRQQIADQQEQLRKAKLDFEEERRQRLLKEAREAAARKARGTGNSVQDANDLINGGKS